MNAIKKKKRLTQTCALLSFTCLLNLSAAVTFNFNPAAGMSQQSIDGFQEAADLWSAILFDNITINIDIDFPALGAGILGSASSQRQTTDYVTYRNLIEADATSADDQTASANLPGGSSFDLYINRTSNNPNGSGSATPYVDNNGSANNTTVRVNQATAKALGLRPATDPASDASISFSSNFSWDFDRSNGITGGQFDFVGVAAHEIGHALGFVSGVDILDSKSPPHNGPFSEDAFTWVGPLDLYRYSAVSAGLGIIDWTANNTDKFLSYDGGTTLLAQFSEGRNFGDGQQASHWKDNLGLGILDPTFSAGELGIIGPNDILALDLIGYNLTATTPAPEPSTVLMALIGLLAIRFLRVKKSIAHKKRIRVWHPARRKRSW